jgi:hypothetical protein
MKYYRYWLILFTTLFFLVEPLRSIAGVVPDQKFISASSLINRQKVFNELKRRSPLPVIFPTKIPAQKNNQPLYVSVSGYGIGNSDYAKFWQINVDTTPTCQGVRVCNIGFLAAQRQGKLTPDYQTLPGNRNHLKEKVVLPGNITGYYTPFHIEAGGVNPTLEWRVNNILYMLSWKIDAPASQQKQILLEIAHSASR